MYWCVYVSREMIYHLWIILDTVIVVPYNHLRYEEPIIIYFDEEPQIDIWTKLLYD